jgi:hypothetical protein
MTEEYLPPESEYAEDLTHKDIVDQLLPLRDRIVKIETVVAYHEKEFQNVKNSISDLSRTMDQQHQVIIEKLEQHNKTFMDVTYAQHRDNAKTNSQLKASIQSNKVTFESYVAKWKAVSWAVWFTITVTLGAVAWGFSTAKDLGLFEITKQTKVEIQQKSKL